MGRGPNASYDSFEEAFRTLMPRAYRVALRLLGDRGAAEDVASEAMARAYARWSQLCETDHADAWVLRVATNLALDAARRGYPHPPVPEPVDVAEVATLRTALVVALRALPRRQREVVALRYLAGMSESSVAHVLHLAEGTVKSHAHRGLAALRGRLGEEVEEVIPDAT